MDYLSRLIERAVDFTGPYPALGIVFLAIIFLIYRLI